MLLDVVRSLKPRVDPRKFHDVEFSGCRGIKVAAMISLTTSWTAPRLFVAGHIVARHSSEDKWSPGLSIGKTNGRRTIGRQDFSSDNGCANGLRHFVAEHLICSAGQGGGGKESKVL